MSSSELEPNFAIGAVSRLTGIPVGTLRIWERRYEVVAPIRTDNNQRCYTRADIARLTLIKQLVDQGHAVGSVVKLAEEALRERLRVHAETPIRPAPGGDKVSVMILGDSLPFLIGGWIDDLPGLDILGAHATQGEFESAVLDKKPEVLVGEYAVLGPDQVQRFHDLARRAAARRVVLVYGFGESAVVERARKLGILPIRAPITARALENACLEAPGSLDGIGTPVAVDGEIPPRLFDNESLAALLNIETRVRCECPHHLSDLVFRLSAFEAYSLDCENRNERDAAIHAHLHRTVARARALVEEALDFLVQAEGIELEPAAEARAVQSD